MPEPEEKPASAVPDHKLRDARELRDQADAAYARGDYAQAAELDRQIVELAPDSEPGGEARKELVNLRPDRVALYSGLFAAALYIVGWIVALW